MSDVEVTTVSRASKVSHINAIGSTKITNPQLKKGKVYRDNKPIDDTVFKLVEIGLDWTQKNRDSGGYSSTNFVIAEIHHAKFEGISDQRSKRIAITRFARGGRTWKRYSVKVDDEGKEYFIVNFDDDYKPVKICVEVNS